MIQTGARQISGFNSVCSIIDQNIKTEKVIRSLPKSSSKTAVGSFRGVCCSLWVTNFGVDFANIIAEGGRITNECTISHPYLLFPPKNEKM